MRRIALARVAGCAGLAFALVLGCQSNRSAPETTASAAPVPPAAPHSDPLVAARPFGLDVPPSYDPSKPAPLLVALHGYGANGEDVAGGAHGGRQGGWGVAQIAAAHGIFVAHPDGTPDRNDRRFWNATDACCNFEKAAVDDVAYLSAVIDDVSARYRIDPKRVWVTGISNGGFMAHRFACARAGKVAAIVSIAGSTWADPARCAQAEAVSVLEVHGGADPRIAYEGATSLLGGRGAPYPAVEATVAQSATKDGCTGALVPAETHAGFDAERPTVATEVARWSGCPAGIDVERWKMPEAGHIPRVTPAWSEAVVAWLEKHPKP
jgi:polyhydroxybutyrate depolymerase